MIRLIQWFLVVLLAVFSSSCSKDVRLNKKLDGKWESYSLKIITSTGLSYFVESTGFIQFEENEQTKAGTYTIAISFEFNGTSEQFNESGTYTISGDQLLRNYGAVQNESRIVYINKKDLELEVPNINNRGYFFVLKRAD